MSANEGENPNKNNLLIYFEQQFRQLLLESRSSELIIKTAQENLNSCLKRCNLLQHELETERLNKSLMKIELDTLNSMNNNIKKNVNNSEFDMNFLIHDREYLTNKIFKTQNENVELKQELTKLNSLISSLKANQFKFSQQVNLVTSMLNSLQGEIKKLKNESHSLVNILCNSKNLAKKMVCAFKYTKNMNKIQFDNIQRLWKEVATTKSNIHILFVNQNENHQVMKSDKINTNCLDQTYLEICKKIIETLETENNALHKSIQQILKNDFNKHTTK